MNKHYVLTSNKKFVVFDPFLFKTSTDINDAEIYTVPVGKLTFWVHDMKNLFETYENITDDDILTLDYKEVKVKL